VRDGVKSVGASSGNPFRAILDVGAALVSSLELEEVFANVAQKIGEAMMVWSVDIQTLDREQGVLLYEAFWCREGVSDDDRAYVGTVTDVRDRPDWRRVVDGGEVVEWHLDDASLPPEERESMTRWGYKTTLDAPLAVGGEVIGVLGVAESRFVRRFTPAEVTLFGQLRSMAAIAIHNAQVFRRQQEQNRRLAALLEVSRALAAGPVPASVCAVITRVAADVFAAPRAIIYECGPERDSLTMRSCFLSESVEGYDTTGVAIQADLVVRDPSVLHGGRAVVDHVGDPGLSEAWRRALVRWNEKTCLTVPLVARGETLGVLILTWTERERRLTPAEIEFAGALAERAAIALHTARLLADSTAGEQRGDRGER
jgi:GAF domain-containing protein